MSSKRKRVLKTATGGIRKKRNHKQQQLEEEVVLGVRDWASGLPDHLIELVIKKLSLVDCLSFGSVCETWRSITINLFEGYSHGIPLLVKYGWKENLTRTCLNVLGNKKNKKLKKRFKIQFPEACRGSCILGSFHDWLFLAKVVGFVAHISLLNPFSGDIFWLPDVDKDADHMKMFLSVVPTDSNCICVLINRCYEKVSICTPRGATRWRKIDLGYCSNGLYHGGNFYFLNAYLQMVIINETSLHSILKVDVADDDDDDDDDHIIHCAETQILRLHWPSPLRHEHTSMIYLLESCGEILFVRRFRKYDCDQASNFEIYRPDLSQMSWLKLERMGDKILFLGNYSSRSFSADKLVGGDALANSINRHTWLMANEPKWRCFRSKFDHWLTAPIWWCLKESFRVESRARRSGRTKRVPSHLASYIV